MFKNKEIVMTIPEFMQVCRKEITIEELRKDKETEKFLLKLYKNPNTKKFIVAFLGITFFLTDKARAITGPEAINTTKIDTFGETVLFLINKVGGWVVLIMCAIDVIRACFNGDTKSIGRIITKYVVTYTAFYAVPWIFELIRTLFNS